MNASHDTHCLDICRCARGTYRYDPATERIAFTPPVARPEPVPVSEPTLHTGQYL